MGRSELTLWQYFSKTNCYVPIERSRGSKWRRESIPFCRLTNLHHFHFHFDEHSKCRSRCTLTASVWPGVMHTQHWPVPWEADPKDGTGWNHTSGGGATDVCVCVRSKSFARKRSHFEFKLLPAPTTPSHGLLRGRGGRKLCLRDRAGPFFTLVAERECVSLCLSVCVAACAIVLKDSQELAPGCSTQAHGTASASRADTLPLTVGSLGFAVVPRRCANYRMAKLKLYVIFFISTKVSSPKNLRRREWCGWLGGLKG